MIYLHSICLNEEEHPQGFSFNIPCIQSLEEMVLKCPLTFFVGENGSGKCTLLEAIACDLQTHAIGSADVSQVDTLDSQRMLAQHLKFKRKGIRRVKLFSRAEDSFGSTQKIKNMLQELLGTEKEFKEDIKGSYGFNLAKGL